MKGNKGGGEGETELQARVHGETQRGRRGRVTKRAVEIGGCAGRIELE